MALDAPEHFVGSRVRNCSMSLQLARSHEQSARHRRAVECYISKMNVTNQAILTQSPSGVDPTPLTHSPGTLFMNPDTVTAPMPRAYAIKQSDRKDAVVTPSLVSQWGLDSGNEGHPSPVTTSSQQTKATGKTKKDEAKDNESFWVGFGGFLRKKRAAVTGVQGGYASILRDTIQADNVRFKGISATLSSDSVMTLNSDPNEMVANTSCLIVAAL
ncbi:hypothetical protein CPB84DRAFT_1845196 [Gymnopilus junonius]|uniref:Uncharacterized protein n=1 Tax=Gymnopilus junonius TaxID=109634 RepID=A0A9P5NTW9_GYMJU|nr:hypothetical protein CPB84DRAFT_1845196 [Gymnopilus junonius]